MIFEENLTNMCRKSINKMRSTTLKHITAHIHTYTYTYVRNTIPFAYKY